jgi:hypothetical protein
MIGRIGEDVEGSHHDELRYVERWRFGDLCGKMFSFTEFKQEGLRENHAVATWDSEPSQHMPKARKTKRSCVEMAGRRTVLIHTDF